MSLTATPITFLPPADPESLALEELPKKKKGAWTVLHTRAYVTTWDEHLRTQDLTGIVQPPPLDLAVAKMLLRLGDKKNPDLGLKKMLERALPDKLRDTVAAINRALGKNRVKVLPLQEIGVKVPGLRAHIFLRPPERPPLLPHYLPITFLEEVPNLWECLVTPRAGHEPSLHNTDDWNFQQVHVESPNKLAFHTFPLTPQFNNNNNERKSRYEHHSGVSIEDFADNRGAPTRTFRNEEGGQGFAFLV